MIIGESIENKMNQEQNKINCPKCGEEIDVNDILYHQVDEQLKKKYNDDITKEKEKYHSLTSQLKKEQEELNAAKNQHSEQVNQQVKSELKKQEISLQEKYKKEAEEEQSEAIVSLQKEVAEKSSKIKELNKTSIEVEQLKREKEELADSIKVESEKKLNQKLATEKERIQKEEKDKNELKTKELEKKLADQKKLTEEMQRKQEQGSMQTQGEVQEIGIEEWLVDKFPLDSIEEIKTGERGADCLQIVNTRSRQNCGAIYYESKRTKLFQQGWVEKFKADIIEKKADIGVLVTEAMPTDMERLGLKDGIWVCSFDEFKGLCTVLRESIIQISAAITTNDNKGDKMGMLYDFLTSNEFRLQIEAIVEGFSQMQTDLLSEKRAMHKIWSQREKQIEKVIQNTAGMYGNIKGIAGNAIQTVKHLELPSDNE